MFVWFTHSPTKMTKKITWAVLILGIPAILFVTVLHFILAWLCGICLHHTLSALAILGGMFALYYKLYQFGVWTRSSNN